jgi:osmotically-inducible protein OsmY
MRVLSLLLMVWMLAGVVAAEKQPLTDDILYDRVIRKIANDRELKTTAIEVTVKDRVVTLRGQVESEKLRQRVEHVVQKVEGVKKVVNELKLRP